MAIIYEVKLAVDPMIEDKFVSWLNDHIKDMLTFDGFLDATLYQEQASLNSYYVVHYRLEAMAKLQAYFDGPAQKMRQEGLNKFPSLEASRRILHVKEHYE